MRIVVVSDTHVPRFAHRMHEAVRRVAAERPDLILHCGDLTTLEATDALAEIAPVEAVAGNNDGPEIVRRYGRRRIVPGAIRVGMIHGDGARGTTLERARAAFAADDVDAVAFGHSHVPHLERDDRTWVVNPGSMTDKRREPRFSYAVLERDGAGQVAARLVFFDAEIAPRRSV